MLLRRIFYLLSLGASALFFLGYQLWFSWFVLLAMLCLPVLSLLLSLLPMTTAKLKLPPSGRITLGTERTLALRCSCLFPAPVWRCKVRAQRPLTVEKWAMTDGNPLPTTHCGTLFFTIEKAKVYDYLGLFRLPMKHDSTRKLQVWPQPIPVKLPASLAFPVHSWHPKRGGGFAENHELRLYRPGDNIQQIHWKLSAKTGSLILREPMDPSQIRIRLGLDLCGTPDELDRKLGRLLWLGNDLLERQLRFDVQARTGKGPLHWPVAEEADLEHLMESLLSCPPAQDTLTNDWGNGLQFYIGGAPDET